MEILNALLDLIQAVGALVWAVVQAVVPWTPLIAWIAFWTLAVNWVRLRSFLLQGGWIGVLLIAVMAVLVWGVIAPPDGGTHSLLGLQVSNFVGKMVYVTALAVIMLLCGSMQLSGCCDSLVNLEQPAGPAHEGHDDSGHVAHEAATHAGH
jgi:hypothetical protein